MPTPQKLMMTQIAGKKCQPETNTGWWTVPGAVCIGAWQAVAAVDYPTSLIDLAGGKYEGSPTSAITEPPAAGGVSAPTWTAIDGWKSPSYNRLDMPISLYGNNTIIVRYSGASATTGVKLFGGLGSEHMDLTIRVYGHSLAWYSDYKIGNIPHNGNSSGIVGMAGPRPIIDKYVIADISFVLDKEIMSHLSIGTARNENGANPNNIQAVAIYCSALTQAETDALGGRMLTL